MSKTDYHKGLVRQIIDAGIQSAGGRNEPANRKLLLAIMGIVLFTGAELVKIIFRKNFGLKGIHKASLFIGFASFLLFGVFTIVYAVKNYGSQNDNPIASNSSFLVTGLLYITLAIYTLYKGLIEIKNANNQSNFTESEGENGLLKILEDYKWSNNLIRYLAEPVYILLLGGLFMLYNPIGGIPLIVCALSVWVQAILESFLTSHFPHSGLYSDPVPKTNTTIRNKVNSNF